MKRITSCSLLITSLVALLAGVLLFSPQISRAADTADQSSVEQKVDQTMAGLSDEQVRQMLITELKKDAELEAPDYDRMKGPAYVFSSILRGLTDEHDQNEDQLSKLFAGMPQVVPDLYRVFVKL